MARDFFRVEKGIDITAENGGPGTKILFGAGIPGVQQQEIDAEVGSLYINTNAPGYAYHKKAAGSGTDKWSRLADYDDVLGLTWRSENVIALTSTAAPADGATIDLVAVPLGGDETPFLTGSDFAVGSYILFGFGGTEKLMQVSNVAGNVITLTDQGFDPLSARDTFIVKNYLPDSGDAQEKQASVYFTGTDYIKLGDINWDFANGIKISSGYTPGSGNPSSADSVESALQKIDGNVDALNSLTGIAQGGTNFGVFSGPVAQNTLPDNTDAKTLFQALENALYLLQVLHDGVVQGTSNTITTTTVVDSFLVDNYSSAEWDMIIELTSDPTRRVAQRVKANHNGTPSADATNPTDDSVGPITRLGTVFSYTVTTDVSGVGVAQVMRLNVAASSAVNVRFTRTVVKAT